MIHWAWLILAWVIGEIMGGMCIIICMGSTDKAEQERRRLEEMGLLYKENKKAADGGTSTAAHEAQKGFFL